MTEILELEIPPLDGEGYERTEWLVLSEHDGWVSFRKDYISQASGGERRTWNDEGISVGFEQLDAVIEALTKVRASQGPGAEQEPK